MPTRVLLLRHGETTDPLVFHGAESDVGLSERGHRQAEVVAQALKRWAPTHVASSAMRRALKTAGPIARTCGVELRIEPELHERRVGALSGTPTHGSDGVWPDTLRLWIAGQTDYAPPGAESYDAIRARVLPAWERVMEYRPGETRVVVAHGVVIRVLLLNLLDGYGVGDWQRLGPIRNVGVTELVHEETGWKALRLNEPPSGLADA